MNESDEEETIRILMDLRKTRFAKVSRPVYHFGEEEITQDQMVDLGEDIANSKVRERKEHITDYFKPTTADITVNKNNLNFRHDATVKFHKKEAKRQRVFNKSVRSSFLAGKAWGKLQDEINKVQTMERIDLQEKVANGTMPDIQNGKHLLIGGDVAALYPSLEQTETAFITGRAVQESSLEFYGIDYEILSAYLALTIGREGMREWGIEHCFPTKLNNLSAESLNSKSNRNQSNWKYHVDNSTTSDRRNMLAAMIQVATLVLMKSSCYTFGGYIYLQQTGSGIGLRASACAAKVVMAVWDICWARIQKACGLKVNIFMRYIDDIRVYLKAIARGWRWNKSKWEYIGVDEDERNDETRTKEELKKSFESIFPFLGFTTEAQEDFETGYLPTLDTQTHVNEIGLILYKHFDKPMASNTTLQKGTALSKSTVFSSLRQDLCRRLLNTSKLESGEVFNKVVEDYTQILINSGHQYSFVKAIILQGITRYKYMVSRSERMPTDPKYRPLYRPRT